MRHREFLAHRLDVAAFAEEGGHLDSQTRLEDLPRWADLQHLDADPTRHVVAWSARGEMRRRHAARPEVWIHLQANATAALTCQRCLGPVDTPMQVDRWFRFADDESQAAAMDGEADDDVLVISKAFNLIELIEDELLLDAPIVPRHEVCPEPLRLNDDAGEAAETASSADHSTKPNPFAALAELKTGIKK